MPDVTGQSYESLVAFLLDCLRHKPTGETLFSYHFEKSFAPACRDTLGICAHADECAVISKAKSLPYGPWYDPDFVLATDGKPFACIHVTHWSSPSDSSRKFWRTIEDHFQFKTLFGRDFLSLNVLFEALPDGEPPRLIRDTKQILELHGWKPAVGSVCAVAFDGCLAFPINYKPLLQFATASKTIKERNPEKRRLEQLKAWQQLATVDSALKAAIVKAAGQLRKLVFGPVNPWYSPAVVASLQSTCFRGRASATNLAASNTRYRKGIQHLFILESTIAKNVNESAAINAVIKQLLQSGPRFSLPRLYNILASAGFDIEGSDKLIQMLSQIPVKVDKRKATFLLNPSAGLRHVAFDQDLGNFCMTVQRMSASVSSELFETLQELFASYRATSGVKDTLEDLASPDRVRHKLEYVLRRISECRNRDEFVTLILEESFVYGTQPLHQRLLQDKNNWFIDAIFAAYDVRRKQDVVAHIGNRFQSETGDSLRRYSFKGNFDQFVNHLIQGEALGTYFRKDVRLSEPDVALVAWQILANLIWEKIRRSSAPTLPEACLFYSYRRAMRIISQSDLEPINFLLKRALKDLSTSAPIRGVFNELAAQRRWSKVALTTEVVGVYPQAKLLVLSHSVFGKKHIADKTRELAARIRSSLLTFTGSGISPVPPELQYALVLDGDWPVESKLNLLEAGFNHIFEIGAAEYALRELVSRDGATPNKAS